MCRNPEGDLRTEILAVAAAFLGLAVTDCAGVVAKQAQSTREQARAGGANANVPLGERSEHI